MEGAGAGEDVGEEFGVFDGFVVVGVDEAGAEGRGVVTAVGPVRPFDSDSAGVAAGGD